MSSWAWPSAMDQLDRTESPTRCNVIHLYQDPRSVRSRDDQGIAAARGGVPPCDIPGDVAADVVLRQPAPGPLVLGHVATRDSRVGAVGCVGHPVGPRVVAQLFRAGRPERTKRSD